MRTKKLLFHLLAALLAGCVPVMSLHPLYTDEDVIFEEKLLGTWLDDSNDTWTFERISEFHESYALTFTDYEGKKGLYEVVKDHSIVLTAPTKELQEFVIKYAEDKRLFVDEKILSRKTDTEPNSLAVNDPNDNKLKNNRRQEAL